MEYPFCYLLFIFKNNNKIPLHSVKKKNIKKYLAWQNNLYFKAPKKAVKNVIQFKIKMHCYTINVFFSLVVQL